MHVVVEFWIGMESGDKYEWVIVGVFFLSSVKDDGEGGGFVGFLGFGI